MSGFPMPPPSSSSGSTSAPIKEIEKEEAKEIINELATIVEDPVNKDQIDALKSLLQSCGSDLMIFMTAILPKVVALASPVLTKHGLPADPFGTLQLFKSFKPLMEDPEIHEMAVKMKNTFLTDELFEILKTMAGSSGLV